MVLLLTAATVPSSDLSILLNLKNSINPNKYKYFSKAVLSKENLEMIIVQHIRMEADSVRSEELCTVYFIHKKNRID